MNIQGVRKIIHVDMDAFFASVEQRDNPDLRGRPIVVGGLPSQRGVVATASYEARKYGIHSAMPSRTAALRCPHVVFVRPRFDVYHQVSDVVREIFHEYTDLVEPLSLDEAYLDVTSNKKGLPSATLIAREIKQRIFEETQLTASAGISINKFLAKTASGINKPNGSYLILPEAAERFVEELAIEKFYGVGHVTAEKMRSLGIHTGADLKRWSEHDLVRQFGKTGSYYFRIARGQDDRPVTPNRVRKSIGAEESYAHDLTDKSTIDAKLAEVATTLVERLHDGSGGRTLTLKVKYADYQQVTRSRTVRESLSQYGQIMTIASELLETTSAEERHVRLLGLALSNLHRDDDACEYVQLTLDFN